MTYGSDGWQLTRPSGPSATFARVTVPGSVSATVRATPLRTRLPSEAPSIKEAAKEADKARATNCEFAKENKKDATAARAMDSKLEDWTSNGTAQSKSRSTTVYGYKGKRAIVKRLKEWCKDVKATSHTQPTTEWLRREGSKLAVAASSENFSSLRV